MKQTLFKTLIFACLIVLTSTFASAVSVNQDASAVNVLACSTSDEYIIEWSANGVSQPQFQNFAEIDTAFLTKGDVWTCSVFERMYDVMTHSFYDESRGSASTTIVNTAPVVMPIASSTILSGSAFTRIVTATDADNDVLSYSLIGAPTGMTISPAGVISYPTAVAGTYTIIVSVTDGQAVVSQSFTLTVTGTIVPLVVTLTATPTTTNITTPVAFTATVSGGATPYTYRWDFDGNGVDEITSTTISAPSFTYTAVGTYTARLNLTDNAGTSVLRTVAITVTTGTVVITPPTAPVFTTTSCPDGEVDKSYTCDVNANGATSFSLLSAPVNMTINSATGVISWKPTKTGMYTFIVRAFNGAAYTDRTFTIEVTKKVDEKASGNDLFIEAIKFNTETPKQGDLLTAYVTLENQGDIDMEDLVVKMTIEDLDVSEETNAFDLNEGDKDTKEISMNLPSQIESGYYMVKFTIMNDDISVVKRREIYINGVSSAAPVSDVTVQPTISGYQPPAQTSQLNWIGIWIMLILFILLLILVGYLTRKAIQEMKNEETDNGSNAFIVALDNDSV